MKKYFLLLLMALPLAVGAQTSNDLSKYLAGAVPVNASGYVYFDRDYDVPGKTSLELFRLLRDYTQTAIVEGPDHLEQARITEADSTTGIIAANIEEHLYFKRKAWTSDFVRFYYQLIFMVKDGAFHAEMRNLRYLYDADASSTVYRAENWITDEEALNRDKTKLLKVPGKFRRFTIDRKDEIFRGAARTTNAAKKVVTVEVED